MADYEAHFDDANPWNVVKGYMDNKTRLHIKIEGQNLVNGGAIAMVEGLRGFIPASRMSLSYIENLEDYLLKELDVIVIDVNEAENRLVLSAREILKEEEQKEREAQIAAIQAGSVLSGVVESIQNYGAFIRLENGLSGLVHISQISSKRVKSVGDVLKKGDEVQVKVHRRQRWQDQSQHESTGRKTGGRRDCRKGRDPESRRDWNKPWITVQEYQAVRLFQFLCI